MSQYPTHPQHPKNNKLIINKDRKKRESKELVILFALLFGNTVFPNLFFLIDDISFHCITRYGTEIFLVLKTGFSILKIGEF